jgi:hypothetical protein
LLADLAAHLKWQVDLRPVDESVIDRSLAGSHFRARTGWLPSSWPDMRDGLAAEYAPAG